MLGLTEKSIHIERPVQEGEREMKAGEQKAVGEL